VREQILSSCRCAQLRGEKYPLFKFHQRPKIKSNKLVAEKAARLAKAKIMKKQLILAASVAVLLAGCSQGSNSGGSSGAGTAEQSTGQGLNAQTQQSGTIQPGTATNSGSVSTNK
jgi:hypothetical protein